MRWFINSVIISLLGTAIKYILKHTWQEYAFLSRLNFSGSATNILWIPSFNDGSCYKFLLILIILILMTWMLDSFSAFKILRTAINIGTIFMNETNFSSFLFQKISEEAVAI